ncbi:AraC family transcriptional regulator [Labrys miyagiensis]
MTMIDTPSPLIETPDVAVATQRVDLLSDILAHIRLSGAVFLRGEYSAPWALASPEHPDLVALLAPGTARLILFHIIREGRAWISAGGFRIEAEAGDIVVLPHAHQHAMGSQDALDPVPIATLLPPPPWKGIPTCRVEGGGEMARIVCGYLQCGDLLFNSFMRRLPPVFRVRPPKGVTADWIDACVNYALEERTQSRQGSAMMLSRLPELLLMEVLRLHCEQDPSGRGWLAATGDAVIGRALALLHSEPSRKWTVEALARSAATSRSVLDARFREMLGQAPIRYLAEWRMQLAADLLRSTDMKMAAIAEEVGYGSEEAFSRAFQRHLGRSPAEWRCVA